MVTDPSNPPGGTPVGSAQRGRQTTLARYTGLPRTLRPQILPCWRLTEPKVLIGNGPLSGLEDAGGEPLPTPADEKGRGEDPKDGESLNTNTPSEG